MTTPKVLHRVVGQGITNTSYKAGVLTEKRSALLFQYFQIDASDPDYEALMAIKADEYSQFAEGVRAIIESKNSSIPGKPVSPESE